LPQPAQESAVFGVIHRQAGALPPEPCGGRLVEVDAVTGHFGGVQVTVAQREVAPEHIQHALCAV